MNNLYGINVSDFSAEMADTVHIPSCPEDVINLIKNSNGKLRVVSTGYNWGLGSASSKIKSSLLCLKNLNKIREINLNDGYAIIEPGVTQEQLSEALKGSERFLNCTASSPFSSIVGNMMDRGVGLHGQRTEDLYGLEVVLGDGTFGSVGWWPCAKRTSINPLGLGASSLHLFTQSDLGIVTAAVVRLRPIPSKREILSLNVDANSISFLVEKIKILTINSVISGVTKIYDGSSSEIYGANEDKTVLHFCLDGFEKMIDLKKRIILEELTEINPEVISAEKIEQDPLISAVHNLYHGNVNLSESIIENTLGVSSEQVDEKGKGWIFILPFVQLNGDDIKTALSLVKSHRTFDEVKIGTTINVLDDKNIDLVIAISFERLPETIKRAHQCFNSLVAGLTKSGYLPYRVDSSHTKHDYSINNYGIDFILADRIKECLDPNHVIMNNKY